MKKLTEDMIRELRERTWGHVDYDGNRYYLLEDAYVINDYSYEARAIRVGDVVDDDGLVMQYIVTWDIIPLHERYTTTNVDEIFFDGRVYTTDKIFKSDSKHIYVAGDDKGDCWYILKREPYFKDDTYRYAYVINDAEDLNSDDTINIYIIKYRDHNVSDDIIHADVLQHYKDAAITIYSHSAELDCEWDFPRDIYESEYSIDLESGRVFRRGDK